MSVQSTKVIFIICLLLGILVCILACTSVPNINLGRSIPDTTPVRSLRITMDVDQREEFFTQLRKFADKHSAEFTLTFYDADKKSFLVVIYGDGFEIDSAALTNHPREIELGFYNIASNPIPQQTVDELFTELKSFINEIPNVMITEEN